MIAIIKTAGKQYKVQQGDNIKLDKILGNEGEQVEFDKVLLLSDESGQDFKIGQPYLEGVKVLGKVIKQGRSKKVEIIKYKPKTRYRRKQGHRQPFTQVEIFKIS